MVSMKRDDYWPEWFDTEMSCYRVIIRGEPVHQEFSVNQSTNNLKENVSLFSRKLGFNMRKKVQNIARK